MIGVQVRIFEPLVRDVTGLSKTNRDDLGSERR